MRVFRVIDEENNEEYWVDEHGAELTPEELIELGIVVPECPICGEPLGNDGYCWHCMDYTGI